MARRSLRSIAGLLANPGRKPKNRKSRRKTTRRKKLPAVYRNGRRGGRFVAKAAKRIRKGAGTRPSRRPGISRRGVTSKRRRSGARRNPAAVAGFINTAKSFARKVPVVGPQAAKVVGIAPNILIGGWAAPMAGFKVHQKISEIYPKFQSWPSGWRYFVVAALGSMAAGVAAKAVRYPNPTAVSAAVGAGIFGAFVGAQGTPNFSGALMLGRKSLGALAYNGMGTAPAFNVGPSMGAVVLGGHY